MSSPVDGPRPDLLTALRQRWLLVLLLAVAGALLLGGAQLLRPDVYTSSADVVWRANGGQVLPELPVADDGDPVRSLSTEAAVVVGDQVMEVAARTADVAADDLREATTVEVQESSNVLVISVTADSAEEARDRAAAVADAYVTGNRERGTASLTAQADALQQQIDTLTRQLDDIAAQEARILDLPGGVLDPTTGVRRDALVEQLAEASQRQNELRTSAALYTGQADVISGAALPDAPSSRSLPVATALGGALGLLVGVLLAIALGRRGPRRTSRPELAGPPADAPPDRRSA